MDIGTTAPLSGASSTTAHAQPPSSVQQQAAQPPVMAIRLPQAGLPAPTPSGMPAVPSLQATAPSSIDIRGRRVRPTFDSRSRSSTPPRLQSAAGILNLPADALRCLIPFLMTADRMVAMRNVARFRAACLHLYQNIPEPIPEGVMGAVEFNRPEELRQVLLELQQSGEDVTEEVNRFGRLKRKAHESKKHERTPLMVAAHLGNMSLVEQLLRVGAKVDQAVAIGWTAIMYAVQNGHADIVQALLQAGAKVDQARSDGWTALMVAAQKGHTATVQMLLQAGAKVDQARPDGSTTLMFAAQNGHTATVQALLQAGANCKFTSKQGNTALSVALQRKHMEVVKLLRSHGADTGASFSGFFRNLFG